MDTNCAAELEISPEITVKELVAEYKRLAGEYEQLKNERNRFKELYMQLLEKCAKLERGILSQQRRERYSTHPNQIALPLIGMLTGNPEPSPPLQTPPSSTPPKKPRPKPTGRKPLPEKLPRIDIEILPPEVQNKGLEAYEKIGEDISETIEKRSASVVVVRVCKPKFAIKERDRLEPTKISQASSPELPIEKGLAGPGFLADTIVRRWQDHTPLHRMENIYGREGLELSRSTICHWHFELAALLQPLINAMWKDSLLSPVLCTDATGVLVRQIEKCRHSHFFVVGAPKHVLFRYSPKHDSQAIDEILKDYREYLIADAHIIYDHLYDDGKVIEVACWAHARRYFFKSLESDPPLAHHALVLIQKLFLIERTIAKAPPEHKKQTRQIESKPIVEEFFLWCDEQSTKVLDQTPISKAIGYSRNQRKALERFLEDGRLPMHNNFSENQLRRIALGRKNWIFVGNDEGGEVHASFVSLLASCQLHSIEPFAYLRDLFCLLPSWPVRRVLELAPAYWKQTLQNEDTQQRLAANIFRKASLGLLDSHCPSK